MANSLQGKKILVGVTGGIAAYKIHFLIRDLVKNGVEVQVVMTQAAHQFVTPLSLSTLSRKPVYTDLYTTNGTWNNHVELALWADVILIAPCTANTMAKMANGICDNLLLSIYLSAKCPVFVVPAMDLDMYVHPTTIANLHQLEENGNYIIPAEEGELASGLTGKGRMAEPRVIFDYFKAFFSNERLSSSLKGKIVLITAGPTFEPIDPVRFIGNYSSGKMGYALAEEAAGRGAKVILISGLSSKYTTHPNISLYHVTSAREMFNEVFKYYEKVDVAIMSAAVADYTPKYYSNQKIKKKEQNFIIELVKSPDILKTMGEKKSHQLLVGFALETDNEIENAKSKLVQKNLDFIILNSLQDSGAGFKTDSNKISIFTKDGESKFFDLKEKTEVAKDILDVVEEKLS